MPRSYYIFIATIVVVVIGYIGLFAYLGANKAEDIARNSEASRHGEVLGAQIYVATHSSSLSNQSVPPTPYTYPTPTFTPSYPRACATDTKICPGGSVVGRDPLNYYCEFAPCP